MHAGVPLQASCAAPALEENAAPGLVRTVVKQQASFVAPLLEGNAALGLVRTGVEEQASNSCPYYLAVTEATICQGLGRCTVSLLVNGQTGFPLQV